MESCVLSAAPPKFGQYGTQPQQQLALSTVLCCETKATCGGVTDK